MSAINTQEDTQDWWYPMSEMWHARAYLVDLDGTLISGRRPLPGAKRLLATMEDRFVLVSNDAEHTPVQLGRILSRIGLSVDVDRILLAGTCALDIIAQDRRNARVLLLGSAMLRSYGRSLGLDMRGHDPEVVLVARDRQFSYDKLSLAANAVRDGAELIAANPDLVHPGWSSKVVPETGALLAAILACTGPVPHRIVGKPEPHLFKRALAILGVGPSDAVMIGDNPQTDGAGAQRLGIGYAAIRPGQPEVLLFGPSRAIAAYRGS